MADKKLIQPFLKHDENSQMDENIAELIHVMGYEGYGLYWSIAEFMHKNKSVKVGKEYLVFWLPTIHRRETDRVD